LPKKWADRKCKLPLRWFVIAGSEAAAMTSTPSAILPSALAAASHGKSALHVFLVIGA